MKLRFYKKGLAYKGGWEFDLILGKYELRIAQHQFALWGNYNPFFNLLF